MNPRTYSFRLAALLVACAPLAFLAPASGAGVTDGWVQRSSILTSNSLDSAYKIVRDAAGDVIVTGSSDNGTAMLDIVTIKYSGADGSMLWQKRYNGPANNNDQPSALAADASGNVVVLGSSFNGTNNDFYTAKYAGTNGALLWEKRYKDPANGDDYPAALAVDTHGNVVVTGSAYNGTNTDYYTAKYAAADGALLWEKRYNGPANSWDQAGSVAVDSVGNVVVTGTSDNGTNSNAYTAKYAAADGALLWEKRSSSANTSADGLALDASGNVVIMGSFGNGSNTDYYTAKYAAADGALLWEQFYNGPADATDYAHAIALDNSGNVVVTGASSGGNPYSGGTDFDYYTAKYAAADGTLLWEQRYNGPANASDVARSVAVDGSGNVIVTGYSDGGVTDFGGTSHDYYTAKYAATDGALLWEQRYNSPGNGSDEAYYGCLAVDANGNVFVTGTSTRRISGPGNSAYASGYYTAKYAAADGAVVWEKRSNGPSNGDAYAAAVALDGSGNVVVAGYYSGGDPLNGGTGYNFYTAKYARTNGALLWERTYNGPANGDDVVSAMTLDSNGNVVVTGYTYNGANTDFYTAKYAATNGALLWERTYNGPQNYDDKAIAVAVDSSGNVVVTGSSKADSPLGGQASDYYTAKYAAADGALLWERRYDGPLHDADIPAALAVDTNGNVVVTGLSFATMANGDYYTVKYAAADGAVLWQKRSSSGHSEPAALALDASGNVVVTGESEGDFYTVKYAAANGALLWQKRYNGPGNDQDQATAVAVDSGGNVVVTGWSYNYAAGYGVDFYTVKYAAANGAVLWEKYYSGPGNDQTFAVAVDGSDNVVVAGTSWGIDTGDDYYTASYAAKDGALLWEKRYNGPANGDDRVAALNGFPTYGSLLAVDRDGMVVVTGSSGAGSTHNIATVVYRQPLPPVSVAMVPAGIRLHFTGVTGHSYNIERAPTATGPWSILATPTAPPGGLIEYTDTNPPTATAFYRTSAP